MQGPRYPVLEAGLGQQFDQRWVIDCLTHWASFLIQLDRLNFLVSCLGTKLAYELFSTARGFYLTLNFILN